VTPETRRQLVEQRLQVVRRLLHERGAAGAWLQTRKNFAWATVGGESHVVLASENGVAGLLVTPSDTRVLTAVNEAARIEDEELAGLPIQVEALPWHAENATVLAAERIAGGRPLADADLEDALLPSRFVLSAPEIERMEWLAERAVAAVRAAIGEAAAGMTEHEIAGVAAARLGSEGIRTPVLLAAADDRIDRYRHPLPSSRPLEHRLMLVAVAERWGLHAAVTRFVELRDPDPELSRRIVAVERIHAVMVAATRPQATLGQVFAATRAAYAEAGHEGEWTLHHQGGIIGYQGRERIAVPDDPTPIGEGMAFAWNPSITGAKAEETIVVDADGARILTGG
jgi:Xaa-Pro aminopeptidase